MGRGQHGHGVPGSYADIVSFYTADNKSKKHSDLISSIEDRSLEIGAAL